jgi:hypothetical protein
MADASHMGYGASLCGAKLVKINNVLQVFTMSNSIDT